MPLEDVVKDSLRVSEVVTVMDNEAENDSVRKTEGEMECVGEVETELLRVGVVVSEKDAIVTVAEAVLAETEPEREPLADKDIDGSVLVPEGENVADRLALSLKDAESE